MHLTDVVEIIVQALEGAMLQACVTAVELTRSHMTDKEMAQRLGVSISTFRRMIAADAGLAALSWLARRKGSVRPRRRWPPEKVVLYLLGKKKGAKGRLDEAHIRHRRTRQGGPNPKAPC